MSEQGAVVFCFRRDLRLSDNPGLSAALATGLPVLPIYIHDPKSEGKWRRGAASNWWLHHSLLSLRDALQGLGGDLAILQGNSEAILHEVCGKVGAHELYLNRSYEPAGRARDSKIVKSLFAAGVQVRSYNGALLHTPSSVATKSGTPFKVFTPFWKSIRERPIAELCPAPIRIVCPSQGLDSLEIRELKLLPKKGWDLRFCETWQPGEPGACERLRAFQKRPPSDYAAKRDTPAVEGISRLSPHLCFGEISPRTIWSQLGLDQREPYLRQIGWREFSAHLLYHFPNTVDRPLKEEFERFPWREDKDSLVSWQKGLTGYPLVDAGMRELWATGWMHNRVRMVAASFLVKQLRLPWQLGAEWFWNTLVDADLANNTMGWQWVAGCGADAAPFFRIFNPSAQGERFDRLGEYTRKWVPELGRLPSKYLFQPWTAPVKALEESGLELGKDYPKPVVEHSVARREALAAYAKMREGG